VGFSIENLEIRESALIIVWYKLQEKHIPLIAFSGILKKECKSPPNFPAIYCHPGIIKTYGIDDDLITCVHQAKFNGATY
jgi:hypothetical protein